MSQAMDVSDAGDSKAVPDPGWNDPPLFSYDTAQAIVQSAKKNVFLNKRVAYPMSGKTNPSVDKASSSPLDMPPVPPVGSVGTPPMSSSIKNLSTSTLPIGEKPADLDDLEMFTATMTTFADLLNDSDEIETTWYGLPRMRFSVFNTSNPISVHECYQWFRFRLEDQFNTSRSLQITKDPLCHLPMIHAIAKLLTVSEISGRVTVDKYNKEEVQKRLDILQKMWEENKLNPDVCRRLYRLSEALKNGDTKCAGNIQAGLMVDHVALCRNWMPALRKLIHHIQVKVPVENNLPASST